MMLVFWVIQLTSIPIISFKFTKKNEWKMQNNKEILNKTILKRI